MTETPHSLAIVRISERSICEGGKTEPRDYDNGAEKAPRCYWLDEH